MQQPKVAWIHTENVAGRSTYKATIMVQQSLLVDQRKKYRAPSTVGAALPEKCRNKCTFSAPPKRLWDNLQGKARQGKARQGYEARLG
jgi:hypothetical protein